MKDALRAADQLDLRLFNQTAGWHAPTLDRVMPALSRAADHSVLWMGTAALLAATGGPRGRRAAARGLASVAVASAGANLVGKRWFGRRRPVLDLVPPDRRVRRTPITTSFPSGHAASAAAFATGVALELPAAAVPVGALAAAVAYSRVYTGAHYPGDVAAGAALGVLVGLVGRRLGLPHAAGRVPGARGARPTNARSRPLPTQPFAARPPAAPTPPARRPRRPPHPAPNCRTAAPATGKEAPRP